MSKWDALIIGAGSAGCALAHELVRAGRRVLVLEAGGSDRSPFIKVPAGVLRVCATHDWGYRSQPDPSRHGASESWTRGRVLGGSSSINGTMFVRGASRDFDSWKIPGWSWADVLPIFREYEHSDQPGTLRGRAGPLHVRTVRRPHRITQAFVESAVAAGLPFNADYNGETQEGVGYAQLTQRRGLRCSSADAFLKPLKKSRNLKILLNAGVEKIEMKDGRAVAVSFVRDGRAERETARDIILCAGAINSPKLLMLSGIGEAQELEHHHIAVAVDLPAVGRHLKEHPLVTLVHRSRIPTHSLTEGWFQKLAIAAEFLRYGEGPLSNLFEGAAFVRSTTAQPAPDLQIITMTAGFAKDPQGTFKRTAYPSMALHVLGSYPRSSGRIRLASADPGAAPLIESRLLTEPADVNALANGIEVVRRIMKTQPINALIEEEISPGESVQGEVALREFVRAHVGIAYHPIGTCRMGVGPESVVAADLRVHGTENLWVADASIVPEPLSGNMNAACMMIGRKLGKELTRAA